MKQLGNFSTSFKNPTKFVLFSLNQLNKYLWNMLRFKFSPFLFLFLFFFFSPRYQFLEYVCAKWLKFEPNSICFMGTKLLADTFLYGPMHLLVFFLYMGLVAGNTLVQMKQDIKHDYFPTLLIEGIVWMCIQVDSFLMNTKIFWTFVSLLMSIFKVNRCPLLLACINLVSICKEACKRGVSQFGEEKKKSNQNKPNQIKQTNKQINKTQHFDFKY